MYYNYVLQSIKNGSFYIGFTNNLRNRLQRHNGKQILSTKRYTPWKLIYHEACLDEKDALRREKYLKTTQGSRLLKRRLKEFLYSNRVMSQ